MKKGNKRVSLSWLATFFDQSSFVCVCVWLGLWCGVCVCELFHQRFFCGLYNGRLLVSGEIYILDPAPLLICVCAHTLLLYTFYARLETASTGGGGGECACMYACVSPFHLKREDGTSTHMYGVPQASSSAILCSNFVTSLPFTLLGRWVALMEYVSFKYSQKEPNSWQ